MLRIRSITGHLFLYALALTLPLMLASALIGWAYIRQEGHRIESLAERQVQLVVSQIESRLAGFRGTLEVLAVGPPLIGGDMNGVRSVLAQMRFPSDIWFTVRDRNGRQLLNTKMPPEAKLPTFIGRGDLQIFIGGYPTRRT